MFHSRFKAALPKENDIIQQKLFSKPGVHLAQAWDPTELLHQAEGVCLGHRRLPNTNIDFLSFKKIPDHLKVLCLGQLHLTDMHQCIYKFPHHAVRNASMRLLNQSLSGGTALETVESARELKICYIDLSPLHQFIVICFAYQLINNS